MPGKPKHAKDIFLAAIDKATPAERAIFLDEACEGDAHLRQRVEALLRAHDDPDDVLEARSASPKTNLATSAGRAASAADAEAIGSHIGPYRLLQKLGEGGMGSVWVAEQQEPVKRRVALKVIKPGLDSTQVLRRFEAERQALALMDHTNIAKALDAGTTSAGRPYFVMELVQGVPITRYCDELHLSVRERLALFVPVCQAIQHAHQKGIIHRDVKPSNVLVCIQDGTPVPKIIDFGVAKALHQRLTDGTMYTEIGAVIGTLEYMSPEQAEMSPLGVDTRADVYALGVLLYELLTGFTPLDKQRLRRAVYSEMVRLIKEEVPAKPSTRLTQSKETLASVAALRRTEPSRLQKELRGDLDWIVMKSIEKDRTRRYEAASSLARDVERYLHDEAVEACPPSASYRFGKFVRRNKGKVLAGTSLFLLLLAGIIGTSWGLVQAVRAREAESEQRQIALTNEALAVANEEKAVAAATAEKQAKETAEARDAETRTVLKFVEDKVFAAARPQGEEGGLGRQVILRKAVEAALPYVDQSFRQHPLTEARLRMTLGKSFYYLGEEQLAADQYQTARVIFMKYLGADNPDTLTSMNNLAGSYAALGRKDEALKLYEETLERRKATLDPDDQDMLQSMNNLANIYEDYHRHADALKLREETLPLMKAKLGSTHRETLTSMNNLANSYENLGRHAEALKLHQETLALRQATLSLNHPDTLQSMHNLASIYDTLGQNSDALKHYDEALTQRKTVLGPDHHDTLMSMLGKSISLVKLGRSLDALPVIDECFRLAAGKVVDPGLVPTLLALRLQHFEKSKDAAGCRETAEMFEKLNRTDTDSLYNAACFRAVTAAALHAGKSDTAAKEATVEADRAMAWLQKAVAAGYKDAANMRMDPDLTAVRDRDDFKKLVAGLETKK